MTRRGRTVGAATVAFALAAASMSATAVQPSDDVEARHAAVQRLREASAATDRKNELLYGNDDRYLVREGLLADRTTRTVTFRAYATGIRGNDPIEFFVIGPASGKAYEAIAVSLARPSDVRAGLEFIGMTPGRGVNYLRNRFFPKGERVNMTFRWEVAEADGTVSRVSARAEQLLLLRGPDGELTGTTLPPTGLVFTGGVFLPPDDDGTVRFHADVTDPGSIASNYNEPTTVLDMPALARQSEVYRSRVINPAFPLDFATPVEVVLEPQQPIDAPPRVVDLTLTATGGPELTRLTFNLDSPGETDAGRPRISLDSGTLPALLGAVAALREAQREPFVTVLPADDLQLRTLEQLYRLLAGLQSDDALRLEPPPETPAGEGHLFYEAFLPDPRWRNPEDRTWQPVELRWRDDGTVVLRDYTERALAPRGEARFTFAETEVADPASLQRLLAERVQQRRPLAIFAPETLTYGQLRRWTAPAVTPDWVVWVFLEPAR